MGLEFEQLPRESNKAYAAFRAYLDLGPERSLAQVAAKLGKSKVLMERWSRKFDWVERVEVHASELARMERDATAALTQAKAAGWVKRQEDHKEEEWALRSELITAGRRVLEKFTDGSKGATLGDVVRAFELASRLGRLSSGLPTEVKEVTTEVSGTIEVEWELALKKVYGGKAETGKAESRNAVVEAEVVQGGQDDGGRMTAGSTSPLTPLPRAERGTTGQRQLTLAATGRVGR